MKISPIQNGNNMPMSDIVRTYSPVSKLNPNKSQQQPKAELQQSQDQQSYSDPETENEQSSVEIEYYEKSTNLQKILNPVIQIIKNQSEQVEHVGNQKNYYKSSQAQIRISNQKGLKHNPVQISKSVVNGGNSGRDTQKQIAMKESAKKKNRRYYQSQSASDNNNDKSLIQSSASSIFSHKPQQNVSKKQAVQIQNKNNDVLQKSDIKLVKKDSLSSSTQIMDSRKKQTNQDQSNRCSQVPLQRCLTFFLIYQICFGYCILVSLVEHNLLILISLLIILIPTYYGYLCVSIARARHQKQSVTENNSDQQFFFKEHKENSKIFNSFYSNVESQVQKKKNIVFQSKDKRSEQPFAMNSFFSQLPKQNLTHWAFTSSEPYQYRQYIMVVPYMANSEVQQISKCYECNSIHKSTKIKHCNRCGFCHLGYDHFCKWLLVCIDGYNYSYFLKFVLSLWIISFIFIISGVYLVTRWSALQNELKQKHGSDRLFAVVAVLVFIQLETVLSFLFSSYITFYHIYLNQYGVTTRQHLLGGIKISNNTIFYKSWFHTLKTNYRHFFIDVIPSHPSQSRVMLDQ